MKRLILLIALSIAASIALAGGNPATYNTKTGRLDIPAVIVDGGPINYSVAFEKADAPATSVHINAFRLLPESVALAEDPSAPEWLFVQTAATAEITSPTTLIVPFQQDVFAFTDRPYRQHEYLNATQFVALWADAGSDSFQAVPSNAVMTWAEDGVVKEAEVELLDAKLVGDGKSIQYTMNTLTSRYPQPIGSQLTTMSMFFDGMSPSLSCSDGNSGSNTGLCHMNEIKDYGYLWQLGLSEPLLADESCVPTSFTNSMVYLQTEYEAEFEGRMLVEEGYSGWTLAAETLRSEPFMDTQPKGGTQALGEIMGILGYLNLKGATPFTELYAMALPVLVENVTDLPDWVHASPPTLEKIYTKLVEGAVVVLGITYGKVQPGILPKTGHAFAAVGVDWVDRNHDGVVDRSEHATIAVVDPLDPSENYGSSPPIATGPTKKTLVRVWEDESGDLVYSYPQYHGDAADPFDANNFLTAKGQIGSFVSINVKRD